MATTATAARSTDHTFDHPPVSDLLLDLNAATARERVLRAALNDAVTASPPILTVGVADSLNTFLTLARDMEAMGRVPVIRFARGENGGIAGVELAELEPKKITTPAALNCKPRTPFVSANHARMVAT